MYIYKITVMPINKSYFGFDTKPSYKLSRWKAHIKECTNGRSTTKLHLAMRKHGIANCQIEIINDNYQTLFELALAEISYIKKYNTYQFGLNSTPGGDGMGRHELNGLTNDEFLQIKISLGEHFRNYNKNVKWANTTFEQRKEMTSHLNTPESNQKKSESLQIFYQHNPESAISRGISIKNWQEQNHEQMKRTNAANGKLGAEKVSKKVKVAFPDGNVIYYDSQSEFLRATGEYAAYIIKKTKEGKTHNGYQAWSIK